MSEEKPKSAVRKIFGIVVSVLTYVFFAICVLALIISIASKKDADGAASFFGKQMRLVISDSMGECDETDVSNYKIKDIPVKSLIFIDLVPEDPEEAKEWYSELEVGDVLTFRYVYVQQETITHRITAITPKEGGYIIDLEGDNKAANADTLKQTIDTSLTDSPNYVIGKVIGQNYLLGLIMTSAKTPVGIICIVIIPCLIIMVFEIFRLVGALTENRKKRERDEKKKRDEEFELMRRQLELLQQQQQQMAAAAAAPQSEPTVQEAESPATEASVDADEPISDDQNNEPKEANAEEAPAEQNSDK